MNEIIDHAQDAKGQDPGKPKVVLVTVNGRPVELPKEKLNGLEIKEAAIQQGVPIQRDFVLQEELPNGNTRIVGDGEDIEVHPHQKFTAIAPDDNS